jgi:predicted Zn-dependent peptidase
MLRRIAPAVCALVLVAPPCASAAGPSLADQVHEYHLDNGLTLLIVENHDSPTIGAVTAFSVGTAEEKPGGIGITHILEHMLFKGTTEIGTSDWEAERPHHERIEELTQQIVRLRAEHHPDEARITALLEERAQEQEAAKEFAVDNELMGLYEGAGGTDLNAFTSPDITAYIQSTPSNRLELWMYLESERLRRPILRQFYTEVENVQEERRLSVEGSPSGKLSENFLGVAYDENGYGFTGIGFPSDIAGITRTETEEWFRVYYAPNRMTVALVGDVDPEEAHRLAKEYFEDIPSQDPPAPLETFDVEKKGIRRVEVEYDAEPRLLMGWPKQQVPSPEHAAMAVVAEVLAGGESSRFQMNLVRGRQIASNVSADNEYPGIRWPNLFVIEALPRAPHTVEELEAAIWEEIGRLGRDGITERELTKAKNRLRAARIRDFQSNLQLAVQLGMYQASFGDWRVLVQAADGIDAVTPDDVRAASARLLRRNRAVVATLVEPSFEPDPAMEATGKKLVAGMVKALGGEKALSAVTGLRTSSEVSLATPAGKMTATAGTVYGVPGRVRSEFSVFGQSQVQIVSPDGAWRVQGGAPTPLEGDDVTDIRADLERDQFFLAYPTVRNDYVLQGTEADGVSSVEVRGPSGRPFVVRLDAKSGLPSSVTYDGTNPMSGADAEIREEYRDYRAVGGVKRPHVIETFIDGESFATATVTEAVLNPDTPADTFGPPSS